MGNIVYDTSISVLETGARCAAFFNPKIKKFIKGQKGLFVRLKADFLGKNYRTAWFHCASLGEFEQARPVIERFREEFPEIKILVTFFSPSGYEVRKNYTGVDFVHYLPIDRPEHAAKFVALVKPEIALFVKYEFWRNYFSELRKRQVPIVSFSAAFRADQYFFKGFGGFGRRMLRRVTHFVVQNEESARLLKGIGLENVSVGGDTRYDRVKATASKPKRFKTVEMFKNEKNLLVLGSVWKEDMRVIASAVQDFKDLKIIIAPHDIGESMLTFAEHTFGQKSVRYSEALPETVSDYDLLLIDNIGMLSSLYATADFAFVGGAFAQGLHNILEASVFGIPVFFGPVFDKYPEGGQLLEAGGGFSVGTPDELREKLGKLLNDRSFAESAGQAAARFTEERAGAAEAVMEVCRELLGE